MPAQATTKPSTAGRVSFSCSMAAESSVEATSTPPLHTVLTTVEFIACIKNSKRLDAMVAETPPPSAQRRAATHVKGRAKFARRAEEQQSRAGQRRAQIRNRNHFAPLRAGRQLGLRAQQRAIQAIGQKEQRAPQIKLAGLPSHRKAAQVHQHDGQQQQRDARQLRRAKRLPQENRVAHGGHQNAAGKQADHQRGIAAADARLQQRKIVQAEYERVRHAQNPGGGRSRKGKSFQRQRGQTDERAIKHGISQR